MKSKSFYGALVLLADAIQLFELKAKHWKASDSSMVYETPHKDLCELLAVFHTFQKIATEVFDYAAHSPHSKSKWKCEPACMYSIAKRFITKEDVFEVKQDD